MRAVSIALPCALAALIALPAGASGPVPAGAGLGAAAGTAPIRTEAATAPRPAPEPFVSGTPTPGNAMAVRGGRADLIFQGTVTANIANAGTPDEYLAFSAGTGPGNSNVGIVFDRDELTAAGPGTHLVRAAGPGGPAGSIGVTYSDGASGHCATGSMNVLSPATYDAGKPTSFAADVTLACADNPTTVIQLRFNSTLGWKQLVATGVPTGLSAVVDETRTGTVTFTAYGTSAVSAGPATLDGLVYLGHDFWHLTADQCAGHTLTPGQTCTVGVQFAPVVPDGTPSGTISAVVRVPDGLAGPAPAGFDAQVFPKAGQPFPPVAYGEYHHTVVVWGAPLALDAGVTVDGYDVYELRAGALVLVGTTAGTRLTVSGLATGAKAVYQVRARYSGGGSGPLSIATAPSTTATTQLLYAMPSAYDSGLYERALSPAGPDVKPYNGVRGIADLAVGRDQRYLAYGWRDPNISADGRAHIVVRPVDQSTADTAIGDPSSAGWDTQPTVAPDSSAVVFTHAATQTSTDTVLRRWNRATGTITDVPGSAGLSDPAYAPDGTSVIAVAPGGGLVRLTLATGALATLPGTQGATEPAVAATGTIAFVRTAADGTSTLWTLAPGGTPKAVPGVPAGLNGQPAFDPSGSRLLYTHAVALYYPHSVRLTNLRTGAGAALTDGAYDAVAPLLLSDAPPLVVLRLQRTTTPSGPAPHRS